MSTDRDRATARLIVAICEPNVHGETRDRMIERAAERVAASPRRGTPEWVAAKLKQAGGLVGPHNADGAIMQTQTLLKAHGYPDLADLVDLQYHVHGQDARTVIAGAGLQVLLFTDDDTCEG